MRSRLATCIGVAAILSACGGSDGLNTPATVNPPSTNVGAAGGNATATPPATTPVSTPAAMQPVTPAAMQPVTPAAMQPVTPAAMQPVTPAQNPMTTPPPAGMPGAIEMDTCGIKTKYAGDNFCIKAPPADKGFQMHIGPNNYDSPEARYVLQPGEELTESFSNTSGNTSEVYYYWRQYRMRPGSHHLIVNAGARRIGGSSNSAKDNPEAGKIAPENEGVGMPLGARTQISNSFHTFNFSEKPVLKEAWVNFWYREKALVKEPTREVFSMLGMNIAPGQHVNKHGSCNITAPGRMLTVYGHVHANNERFSVWRTRGGDKKLIHEAYDWEHPHVSEYSSTVLNPVLDPANKKDGGFNGIVDLMPGDKVEFECQILNDTNKVFLGANEAEDDEMCILIGDTVGTTIPIGCTPSDIPVTK